MFEGFGEEGRPATEWGSLPCLSAGFTLDFRPRRPRRTRARGGRESRRHTGAEKGCTTWRRGDGAPGREPRAVSRGAAAELARARARALCAREGDAAIASRGAARGPNAWGFFSDRPCVDPGPKTDQHQLSSMSAPSRPQNGPTTTLKLGINLDLSGRPAGRSANRPAASHPTTGRPADRTVADRSADCPPARPPARQHDRPTD